MKYLKYFILILFLPLCVSCGVYLDNDTLDIGLLDESYSYQLSADDTSWDLWGSDDMLFSVRKGDLPAGVVMSSDGTLVGTPTELGNFEFQITAYSVDEGWFEEDDVDSDADWFTLFVTEPSTNEDCASPSSRNTTETYICLGTVEVETLAVDESFDLDINYYVNLENAEKYDISRIQFSIAYDSENFALNDDDLTSQILREAATRANASISFDTSTPGTLVITITEDTKSFHKAGRMLDLPFYALQDLTAGDYDFTVSILAIDYNTDQTIPDSIEVDGTLTVQENIVAEETDEEADTEE